MKSPQSESPKPYFRWYLISNAKHKRNGGRVIDRATSLRAAFGRAADLLAGTGQNQSPPFQKIDLVDADTGQITTLTKK